jgi:predicted AAA+ superfamily ATPase
MLAVLALLARHYFFMSDTLYIEPLLKRIADALDRLAPLPRPHCDFSQVNAARWRRDEAIHGGGYLAPVHKPHAIDEMALVAVSRQFTLLDNNTRQFVAQQPANNVLLTGSRGTGKSSMVKIMLAKYASQGLRLIEVEKDALADLPDIVALTETLSYRFIIFCDDLSFESGEPGYKALKAILDGSIASTSANLLIYATSNRRHLLPEYHHENLETKYVGEEIHAGEAIEEKISLSERFGLWLSFYPFSQDEYLDAVMSWLAHFNITDLTRDEIKNDAVQWQLQRGSRSGRVAWQYAKNLAGQRALA